MELKEFSVGEKHTYRFDLFNIKEIPSCQNTEACELFSSFMERDLNGILQEEKWDRIKKLMGRKEDLLKELESIIIEIHLLRNLNGKESK